MLNQKFDVLESSVKLLKYNYYSDLLNLLAISEVQYTSDILSNIWVIQLLIKRTKNTKVNIIYIIGSLRYKEKSA